MKYYSLSVLLLSLVFVNACNRDDHGHDHHDHEHEHDTTTVYQITIESPSEEHVEMHDTMEMELHFESNVGGMVHHIKVEIVDVESDEIIYAMPHEEHVHTPEKYEFKDGYVISEGNGFARDKHYKLIARAWGHDEGAHETLKEHAFHVMP